MLLIRFMQEQEIDVAVELLAESMLLSKPYVKLLAFFVKQYLIERRTLMPHTATLIAFHRRYSDDEGSEMEAIQLVRTLEAGNGWHLLKASEELISQMSLVREVYLHCRMIDSALFNMYSKAGYSVVKTDNNFDPLNITKT